MQKTAEIDISSLPQTAQDGTIRTYWNERAASYSCGVCEELVGEKYADWIALLEEKTASVREKARRAGVRPRALDLGCGPGFFSIIFSRMGFDVVAVDSSVEMLENAADNARRAEATSVSFQEADALALDFPDGSFDVVASRNVTWLMKDPFGAYQEWARTLAPGGKLLVFDANWYRYLVDPCVNAQRIIDQAPSAEILGWNEDAIATDDQEDRCEQIALGLPTTYLLRPEWDVRALSDLAFSSVRADEEVWKTLWTEGEQAFYGSSPMFLVEAEK